VGGVVLVLEEGVPEVEGDGFDHGGLPVTGI